MSPGPDRHPLIAARRVAVARADGRRRLARILSVLAVGALCGAGFATLHSPLFAARHVRVLGALHTPLPEVLAVTGLAARPPLIDVDTAADAAAVERLAWVGAAQVRRDWPDGVTVSIVERRPVAALPLARGGFALADATGRVLAVAREVPAGVREVRAAAGPGRPGEQLPAAERPLLAVAAGLPNGVAREVRFIAAEGGGGVELRLAAGPLVLLGQGGDLGEQAVALATLLAKVPMRGIVTIDLRVPDAPVLTP